MPLRVFPHSGTRTIFCCALLALCAGCAPPVRQIVGESNYFTYEHPFTDAGAEAARRSAASQCAPKKQVAVKTSSACSLTRCTTHFQCMDAAEAAAYQPREDKK